MPANTIPSPTITLTELQARRFLLAHQRLLPPRSLEGKPGALDFIRHIGCIQYDPVNVVSRNPDLVLQARVRNYQPGILDELLYTDRLLKDGWDKQAAIYPVEDYPHFHRRRLHMREHYLQDHHPAAKALPEILALITREGPKSSLDLQHDTKIMGPWGVETRLGRTALEILDATGQTGIHHRVNTRRFFDLNERLLPPEIYAAPDPHPCLEDYHEWHVLRRVGSLGLANPAASEYWLGILDMKSQARSQTLTRLVEKGSLVAIAIEGLNSRTFFMRSQDLPTLHSLDLQPLRERHAAFLPPLDNLLWDRSLLRWVFHFDYVWEVYKKPHQRKYGYYTLPVLLGDRFVARFESVLERKSRTLTLKNWWWEDEYQPDAADAEALRTCMKQFLVSLGAEQAQPAADAPHLTPYEWLWSC